MTDLEIRNIEINDYYKNILPLLKQLSSLDIEKISYYDFKMFIKNLNSNHLIKIIEDKNNNQIIGSITVLIENKIIHNFGKVAHIEDVVIDNRYRGLGLGKKLMDTAYKTAKSNNCYKIILHCKEELEKFYQKNSFEKNGIEMNLRL